MNVKQKILFCLMSKFSKSDLDRGAGGYRGGSSESDEDAVCFDAVTQRKPTAPVPSSSSPIRIHVTQEFRAFEWGEPSTASHEQAMLSFADAKDSMVAIDMEGLESGKMCRYLQIAIKRLGHYEKPRQCGGFSPFVKSMLRRVKRIACFSACGDIEALVLGGM